MRKLNLEEYKVQISQPREQNSPLNLYYFRVIHLAQLPPIIAGFIEFRLV